MNLSQIRAAIRRSKLHLIRGNSAAAKFTVMKRKSPESLGSLVDDNIFYQTLPSSEELGRNTQAEPHHEIIRRKDNGTQVAQLPPMDIVRNAGTLTIPDEPDIPNEYEFEILRLRRRVESLECSIRDRDERNVQAITMLEDELQMWRTFFHDHVAETHDGIRRRILRIESTLMTLKTVTSRIVSPLEIPERWRKS